MAISMKDQAVLESIFNPLLPLGDVAAKLQNENEINEENTEDVMSAKQLEASGVEKAEQGDLDGALECFNQACQICPLRSSCFNNRAQLWRLKGDIPSALEDLDKAIQLGKDRGAAAAQAHTQRALIHSLNGNEDKALKDFTKAAELGNAFARSVVVQMNPYAAMCNRMLADAINQLRGEPI
ncbi:tetratricopeptide repeat protein 36 homolog [Stylophora pistillata]|uniref:Tetratricopeptide repeat protein 36 n=1 Tax=Stylophora pistillata TaxID=50429 RepID=A0A2B4SEG0_STYPI|nr:tetratricopeptide repeat protein 36 homolog [Stylophora pistillata]XP_022788363.1 tetratricopeptide repeat protein 36 homolog [Stylophora pistillata]XP_022788365.1 tetratricopeptide repeat protein 36 homolog [Stylophora pistillata]PFX26947.1 Tetratricopeptide repeat protein 36 [Stylophora pistillata]